MLKRIAKMPYIHDQAEAFELSYMVLANFYIDKASHRGSGLRGV